MTDIPKGWIAGPLRKFAPLQRGFDLPTSKIIPGDFPVVYSNGIGRFHNIALLNGPGVITGRSGTIGRVHFVECGYWPHNTALWVTDFKTCVPKFVYYLLQSIGLERFAGGSGVPTLNRNDAHAFEISVPASRQEQVGIAEALTEADELIATLERLTSKKRAIKQGMMQQLLTGKTRLPGFTASWRDVTIGDLASVSSGGTPSTRDSSLWGGGIPWFTPAEIPESGAGVVTTSDRTITTAGLQRSAAKLLPEGAVLVTSRASIGHCAIAGRPVATNQGFTSLTPSDRRSTEFLYYWVQQHRSRIISRAAGSTFLEISGSKVAEIEILAPAADEQAAIGAVLSDADAELRGLQQRLTKARNVKQGMMQQLLTGRTRLPVEDAL